MRLAPLVVVCALAGSILPTRAIADEPLTLFQERDNAPARMLTAAEIATLGDPFFNAALRSHADATKLSEVFQLLQPDPAQRQLFVVDETIANPRKQQSRRAVISFSGTSPQTGEVLDTNVMFSVFFDSSSFPNEARSIEAWGWDNFRGRYNYYKMDISGTPSMRKVWKFRGSSDGADLLSQVERQSTCLVCHVNGGPIMKELAFPWNNWHSFKFQADYLLSSASPDRRWPVASMLPSVAPLKGAEDLETGGILPAIRQFNVRRVNRSLVRRDVDGNIAIDEQGRARVAEGRRLLRSLFVTTEVNLISSSQVSGLHPLGGDAGQGPAQPVKVPATFFLNSNLMAGGGPTGYLGLGVAESRDFGNAAVIAPEEYKQIVLQSGVRLGGQAGDTNFAWFVPEPSHVDNDLVDRLVRRGILTPQLVASVLCIDIKHAVFSEPRARLLRFVPETFSFVPIAEGATPPANRHPDDLTKAIISALEAASPSQGTSEADFLAILRMADPVGELRRRTTAYLGEVRDLLAAPATRGAELRRLQEVAIEIRTRMKDDPVLSNLDETGDRLFPIP